MDNTNDAGAVTISVHGTFAGDSQNEGEKWWQAGSAFAQKLGRYLPRGVRLASGREVFHWSGENSERARSVAAAGLLKHLEQQEAEGKAYHLVGHSHGGSVIWHTLKLAEHAKKPLRGLRSWTTVGTPFLQHRSHSAFSLMNVVMILLTLALLKPAISNAVALYGVTRAAVVGAKPDIVMPGANRSGLEAALKSPFLCLMEGLGVPMTEAANGGLRIGTFTPESELSFAAYLLTTREGVTVLGVLVLSCYTFTVLAVQAFAPALESHRIRAERHLEHRTFDRFSDSWLGLSSDHDEAISGLRATLSLSATFVRDMMPRERIFISDTPSLIKRPIFWLVAPIFNRLVRPLANKQVRQIVTRSAQGNDRPTAELVAVTPTPVELGDAEFHSLPQELNDRMLEQANREAQKFVPTFRQLLCQPSFATGLETLGDKLTGKELIHTAYFEHDEIAALIGCNISLEEHAEDVSAACLQSPHYLREWLADIKRAEATDGQLPGWLTEQPRGYLRAA